MPNDSNNIRVFFAFLVSSVSTVVIFLNFVVLFPRLENRFWIFWWLRYRKSFQSCSINPKYKKSIKSVHILRSSRLLYVCKVNNFHNFVKNSKTGSFVFPPINELLQKKEFSSIFLKKISSIYDKSSFDLGIDAPFITGQKSLYCVIGRTQPNSFQVYLFYKTANKIQAFQESLVIEKFIYKSRWTKILNSKS